MDKARGPGPHSPSLFPAALRGAYHKTGARLGPVPGWRGPRAAPNPVTRSVPRSGRQDREGEASKQPGRTCRPRGRRARDPQASAGSERVVPTPRPHVALGNGGPSLYCHALAPRNRKRKPLRVLVHPWIHSRPAARARQSAPPSRLGQARPLPFAALQIMLPSLGEAPAQLRTRVHPGPGSEIAPFFSGCGRSRSGSAVLPSRPCTSGPMQHARTNTQCLYVILSWTRLCTRRLAPVAGACTYGYGGQKITPVRLAPGAGAPFPDFASCLVPLMVT
jgi:hypothetical protein